MKVSWLIHVGIILALLIGIPIFMGLFFGGVARIGSINLCIFMFGVPLTFAYLGLRSIKILISINLIISIPLILVSGIFAYEKGPTQMIALPLTLYALVLFIINIIAIAIFRGNYGLKALIPVIISIGTFFLCLFSFVVGNQISLYVFNKRIDLFEDAVRMIDGRIVDNNPIRMRDNEIPEKYRKLAYFIYGEKKNNILRADFYWGRGFPLKHTAYVYLSNDRIPENDRDFRDDWHICYRIREKWFRASD